MPSSGCTSLKSIEFPDSVTDIGSCAMQGCKVLENIKLSNSISIINAYTMAYTNISEIEIPEGIETIGGYVFEGCAKLEKIIIPNSLKSINAGAFWSAINLKDIQIGEQNESFKFENGLLMSKNGEQVYFGLLSLLNIEIPEGVQIIKNDAFSGSNATTISLPNSIGELTGYEFTGMNNLKTINVNSDNPKYKVGDGNLYSKNGEELVKYLQTGDTITIPEGVKTIKSRACTGKKIKEIKLPSTLVNLESKSLSGLEGVLNIYIPENVVAFSSGVLPANAKVKVSVQNNNIKSVDDSMILSKDGKILYATSYAVSEFNIPNTVETIEVESFYDNVKIGNIVIPEGVKNIKQIAFGYSNIESITIPNSMKSIDTTAFINCANLKSIKINKKKDSILGSPWNCPIGERAVEWLEK